jgi:SAM-dependent methyltransferase
MSKQLWLDGAGDEYYQRNKKDLGQGNDLIWPLIEALDLRGGNALEVGCADGWRLRRLQDERGMAVFGVDPSMQAIKKARSLNPKGNHLWSTADNLHFNSDQMQLVILGFCLWFIEPELWFKVVTESDRVLADKGVLIIHDFVAPRAIKWRSWCAEGGETEKQTHAWAYDFPKLWLAHPWYRKVLENLGFRNTGILLMMEHAVALVKDKATVPGADIPSPVDPVRQIT